MNCKILKKSTTFHNQFVYYFNSEKEARTWRRTQDKLIDPKSGENRHVRVCQVPIQYAEYVRVGGPSAELSGQEETCRGGKPTVHTQTGGQVRILCET